MKYINGKYHIESADELYNIVDESGATLADRIKAPENQTVLWSGSQHPFAYGSENIDNYYGPEVASYVASEHGGQTLEDTLDKSNIVLPEWDADNPESIECWKSAWSGRAGCRCDR